MRPEYELLFACVRQDFQDSYKKAVIALAQKHAIDWDLVFSTAGTHGVGPLVYTNLVQRLDSELHIPQGTLEKFRLSVFRQTLWQESRAQRLVEALAFFKSMSIEVMLVKGVALGALVYEYPWLTVPNDLDLILRCRREDLPEGAIDQINHFMHRSGVEYDFYEHHDLTLNGTLPVDFRRVWGDAVNIQFGGQDVFAMSPADTIIALCINSCRKRYFRLKSLCDIAETLQKYRELNWGELCAKAKAYDCSNIVYAALQITQMTVGCELPGGLRVDLGVGHTRAAAIDRYSQLLLRSRALSVYPPVGINLLGRPIDPSLLLPYLTYRGYQIWRRMRYVLLE